MLKKFAGSCLLLFSLFNTSGIAFSQNTFTMAQNLAFAGPDTVLMGANVFDSCITIYNGMTMPFFSYQVFRQVNGGTIDSMYSSSLANISDSTSIVLFFGDSVASPRYGGGINVVVVWPEAPIVVTLDSQTKIVFIDTSDVGILRARECKFSVYPNPSQQKIYVDWKGPFIDNLWIELRDVNGALHFRKEFFEGAISTENLSSGVYFVTLFEGERRLQTIRVIRE